MRPAFSAILVLGAVFGFSDGFAAADEWQIDAARLVSRYEAYKSGPSPIVSEMNGGWPILLVYEDGEVIFREEGLTEKALAADDGGSSRRRLEQRPSGSGYFEARLTAGELKSFLRRIADSEFTTLEANYRLIQLSDLSTHTIRLHLPDGTKKEVAVYGLLDPAQRARIKAAPHLEPPAAFVRLHEFLSDFRPANAKPWEPGFVEVTMVDYSYAPDPSLMWPIGWPDLSSPLVRAGGNRGYTKYLLILPSEKVAEVHSFLERGTKRAAVQIGKEKFSLGLRWPFPGEKNWSNWNF
jgi:hypothetical protein